jgi:hypothetical protein
MAENNVVVEILSFFDSKGFKAFQSSVKTAMGMGISFAIALDRAFNSTGTQINNLRLATSGVTKDFTNLQKYLSAANYDINTNSEAVESDIENLSSKIRAFRNGVNDESFAFAGISLDGNVEDVIENIRSSLANMPEARKNFLADKMGVSNLLHVLKMSKAEMESMSIVSPLSAEQSKAITQTASYLKQIRTAFLDLKNIALAELGKDIQLHLIDFLQWIKTNKNEIILTFKNIGIVMTNFVLIIGRSVALIATLFEKIGSTKIGVAGLTVAFSLLMLTVAPFTTKILALGLILEDIWVYLKGGQSVLGDFINMIKSSELGQAMVLIGGIATAALGLSVALKSLSTIKVFKDISKDLIGLSNDLNNIPKGITEVVASFFALKEGFDILDNLLSDKPREESEGGLVNVAKKAGAGAVVGRYFGGVPGMAIGAGAGVVLGAGQNFYNSIKRENINNQNQFNNQEYNQTNSPKNITLTQNFNIQGKQSADEILRIAKKQSTEAVANAFKNYIR